MPSLSHFDSKRRANVDADLVILSASVLALKINGSQSVSIFWTSVVTIENPIHEVEIARGL